MNFFYFFVILIFFASCSFDDKSGIWNNSGIITNDDKNQFKDFKKISSSNNFFDKVIPFDKKKTLKVTKIVNPSEWRENFYSKSNNFDNFKYEFLNKIQFKSKRISKYQINDYLLFINNKLILNDEGGNILMYSIEENKLIANFNFYKKKYKNFKKKLNLIAENNIIYASDNLGYLYAYDINKNNLIWAKNFKIPFSSNLKISNDKLFSADVNNTLIVINKTNGDIVKQIPSEENLVRKNFKNNLSQNNSSILYLNSFGSLYSVDKKTLNINWFINLNPTTGTSNLNLFDSNQIINNDNFVIVTTDRFTYVLDALDGSIIFRTNFISKIKPLLINDHLFLISKNNLLISFNINKGEIVYSYDVNKEISEFLNIKKKQVRFQSLTFVNNDLLIFLQNSYVLRFSVEGELKDIYNLPSKIKTYPIFIDTKMLFVDLKKKLFVIN